MTQSFNAATEGNSVEGLRVLRIAPAETGFNAATEGNSVEGAYDAASKSVVIGPMLQCGHGGELRGRSTH
jgi:hypothetical protein